MRSVVVTFVLCATISIVSGFCGCDAWLANIIDERDDYLPSGPFLLTFADIDRYRAEYVHANSYHSAEAYVAKNKNAYLQVVGKCIACAVRNCHAHKCETCTAHFHFECDRRVLEATATMVKLELLRNGYHVTGIGIDKWNPFVSPELSVNLTTGLPPWRPLDNRSVLITK